jgi:C4-dicarboxylate transporter DctM subunit
MILPVIFAVLIFILTGAPLFAIVGVATTLCLAFFTDFHHWMDLKILIQHIENLATKQEFLAIPLFMASGAIMTAGGIAKRLVELMEALLGWLPGGLAISAVAACMFFAAISGSSPVTLIAVGSMMVPALVKARYPENFSIGLITTAGSLGCLVPPSISMLIYSISVSGASSVDPSDLFLAGLIPALMIAGMLAVYSMWVGYQEEKKGNAVRVPFSAQKLAEKARDGIWSLMLPVIVLGGIYGGWYTPSQAGAVAVGYSLWVTIWIYQELSWLKVLDALKGSASLMGALLPIIVLAFGLNDFLALIDVQSFLMDLIKKLNPSPAQFMLMVNVVLIVLGALMDSISATLIFAPLLAPIASELFGIHPIHFGIVFVVNMEIGYLMPPVATNLFVASAVFKKPFGQVTKAVLPTLALTCAALVMIIYLPTISLFSLNLKNNQPAFVSFPWTGKQSAPSGQVGSAGQQDEAPKTLNLKSLTGKMMDDLQEPTPEEKSSESKKKE